MKASDFNRQLAITESYNKEQNRTKQENYKTKLRCIKAGTCSICGNPLNLAIRLKTRLYQLSCMLFIFIGIWLLFQDHLWLGIASICIGIIALKEATRQPTGQPTCSHGCTVKKVYNMSINDDEHKAYINCINNELQKYYKHRLKNRYDDDPMKTFLKEVNIFIVDCICEFVNILIMLFLFLTGFVIIPLYILWPIF